MIVGRPGAPSATNIRCVACTRGSARLLELCAQSRGLRDNTAQGSVAAWRFGESWVMHGKFAKLLGYKMFSGVVTLIRDIRRIAQVLYIMII